MKRIFEKLESKHPEGFKGVLYQLGWGYRTYTNIRNGITLPTSKKAVDLIKVGERLGVKIDFNAIYKVLLS